MRRTLSDLSTSNPFANQRKTPRAQWDGLPYDGPVRDFKKSDPPELQPILTYKSNVRQLRMDDEEDVRLFEEVQELTLKEQARIVSADRQYDPDIATWRVLLIWYDMSYTSPDLGST